MNRTEALDCYSWLLAAWPAARDQHDEPTVRLWVERLEQLDRTVATEALEQLSRTCRFVPSLADLDGQVRTIVQQRRHDRPVPQLDPPARTEIARRFLAAIRPLFDGPARTPIVARDLDAAGITDWRHRLHDALRRDSAEGTHRRHFDLAWTRIRDELAATRTTTTEHDQ